MWTLVSAVVWYDQISRYILLQQLPPSPPPLPLMLGRVPTVPLQSQPAIKGEVCTCLPLRLCVQFLQDDHSLRKDERGNPQRVSINSLSFLEFLSLPVCHLAEPGVPVRHNIFVFSARTTPTTNSNENFTIIYFSSSEKLLKMPALPF